MNVPARLAAFAAGLVVVFGAGWGIGAAVGPLDDGSGTGTGTGTGTVHRDAVRSHGSTVPADPHGRAGSHGDGGSRGDGGS